MSITNSTYSTSVMIPLSVLENTAANGVTPSLSATSTEEGERSERKASTLKMLLIESAAGPKGTGNGIAKNLFKGNL